MDSFFNKRVSYLIIVVLGLLLASCTIVQGASQPLQVNCTKDGRFVVQVNNEPWLRSAPTYFQVQGQQYSTFDGSLLLQDTYPDKGVDGVGAWDSINFRYLAGGTTVVTYVRSYRDVPAVVFGQNFPDGVDNSTVGNKNLIETAFPNFKVDGTGLDLAYLAYGHLFIGNMEKKFGRWGLKTLNVNDGLDGGPLVLVDTQKNTLWISAFSSFMVGSTWHDKTNGYYGWGIMGGVKNIPKQFKYETIIYYGRGMREAVLDWGVAMRRQYQKDTGYRDSDITNTHLSYWTDNGAYYVNYYVKGYKIQNLTYEEALLKYMSYADQVGLPYRSIQYSVWYVTDHGTYGGVKEWEANPLLIPDGMDFMRDTIGIPVTAHNRFWTEDTVYAKQNGGKYNFIVEKGYSIPQDQQFWTDLFLQSKKWNFANYMQDWLNTQFVNMNATTQTVDVARNWLIQMGEGARLNGITVQYCMSLSRHILQSLEIPTVTQARASDDYQPSKDYSYEQWKLGFSGMFGWALGLAVFKDTFWSTSDQPDNFYKSREPYPEFQSLVSSLTAGPVSPGDMIGGTNVSLVMRCCNKNGLILKPDRPALPVDSQIIQYGLKGSYGPDGEVWTTYSDIGPYRFGIIFAAEMKNYYSLGSTEAFGKNFPPSKIYSWWDPPSSEWPGFDDNLPVHLSPGCTLGHFCLFYTSPIFTFQNNELILLGERSKWIPMSRHRFTSIHYDESDFQIYLKGAVAEEVVVHYLLGTQPGNVICIMSLAGTARISFKDLACYTE